MEFTKSQLSAFRESEFGHVVGTPHRAQVEEAAQEKHVDHVWITLNIERQESLELSVSTFSNRNHAAGFDPRIRIGCVKSEWKELPQHCIEPAHGFAYETIEQQHNIYYETYEKEDVESLLLEKTNRATLIEAWGKPYQRRRLGLHQIHSMRASCAVKESLLNQDGALRFYFKEPNLSEILLLKFCGQ
ncbi:MAG: hypothetical protein ACK5LK_10165 [Chthoniobacterales bacterium]